MTSSSEHESHQEFRWSWQDPWSDGSFFAIDGAYELAYAAPARARRGGERDGYVAYLIAATIRSLT